MDGCFGVLEVSRAPIRQSSGTAVGTKIASMHGHLDGTRRSLNKRLRMGRLEIVVGTDCCGSVTSVRLTIG